MPRRCGIEPSILVRLATGEPAGDFELVVAALPHVTRLNIKAVRP